MDDRTGAQAGGGAARLRLDEAHIGIMVEDIEVSKRFYTDVLGFQVDYEQSIGSADEIKLAFISNGSTSVELVQRPGHERRSNGPVDHIAFQVKDIEAVKAHLKAKGVAFEQDEPFYSATLFPNGSRWIFFSGPDGERLELNERL